MKKLTILLSLIIVFVCGCGIKNNEDVLKKFKDKVNNTKSYKIDGTMEISNDEETFNYEIESYYLKDGFYKVVLKNKNNNHEQIILKNKNDVYVITPSLNKSFKFESEWPDNSSQSYLLSSLINDIMEDKNHEIMENDDEYIIKTSVNYPNNAELKYQKIYLKDDNIEKVEVYDTNDIVKIKVIFNNVDYKANLDEKEFDLNNYVKNEPSETELNSDNKTNATCSTESNEDCNNSEEKNIQNTTNIENIIYPLYIPSNTFLTSSEKIEGTNGNRIILTFSGEKNFVLIEEATLRNDNMSIIPVYGEPMMLSESIGALSHNSLSWDLNNISYYLASTELNTNEMRAIANSLGNNSLVANTK